MANIKIACLLGSGFEDSEFRIPVDGLKKAGFQVDIIGMKAGGRRKLTVPSDLAYGDRGMGAVIPPRSTLNFDIELLSIK